MTGFKDDEVVVKDDEMIFEDVSKEFLYVIVLILERMLLLFLIGIQILFENLSFVKDSIFFVYGNFDSIFNGKEYYILKFFFYY